MYSLVELLELRDCKHFGDDTFTVFIRSFVILEIVNVLANNQK